MLAGRPEYFERMPAHVDPSAVDPSTAALVLAGVLALEEEEEEEEELELHATRARLAASATTEIPVKAPDRLYMSSSCRSSIRGSWLGWIPRKHAQATRACARGVSLHHVLPARDWSLSRVSVAGVTTIVKSIATRVSRTGAYICR